MSIGAFPFSAIVVLKRNVFAEFMEKNVVPICEYPSAAYFILENDLPFFTLDKKFIRAPFHY